MKILLILFTCSFFLQAFAQNRPQNLPPSKSESKLIGLWERTEWGLYNIIVFKNDSLATFEFNLGKYEDYNYRIENEHIYLINSKGNESNFKISKLTDSTLIIDKLFNYEEQFIYTKFVPKKNKEFVDGIGDASKDINNGILKEKTYGLPVEWFGEYQRIFKENYNVEIEPVAGCVVTTEIQNYVSDYNKISKQKIKSLYGENIFDHVEKMAMESSNSDYEETSLDTNTLNLDSLIKTLK